ncbi:hypothetical protein D3C75_1229130 [compost metagenome]
MIRDNPRNVPDSRHVVYAEGDAVHGLDCNNGTRLIRQRHEQETCGEHQTGKSEQRQLLEPVTVSAQGKKDGDFAQG